MAQPLAQSPETTGMGLDGRKRLNPGRETGQDRTSKQ